MVKLHRDVSEFFRVPTVVALYSLFVTILHVLRRISRCFKENDSPRTEPKIVTPTTSKAIIESLVTNVVAKQLDMPSLMHDDIQEVDEESDEESSKEVDAADDWEQDNEEAVDEDPMASQEPKMSLCQPLQLELTKPSISTLTKSQKPERRKKLSKTGDTRREVLNAI
jgi:hypothetical protein